MIPDDRNTAPRTRLGAWPRPGGGVDFRVWAPNREVSVRISPGRADERVVPLSPAEDGYRTGTVPEAGPGTRYLLRVDDGSGPRDLPDPVSRALPDGVHGPSEVVDLGAHRFADDGWRGHERRDLVIYELHVGTFTGAGTFDAIHPELPRLRTLGVTALELMPLGRFPGARNWGYDGVQPFAVHEAYGGAAGLQRLVDAAHREGLSILVDVVPNHLGPEGCYLAAFGPYFHDHLHTPWGPAPNFDGPGSDEVRRFFIDHALELIRDHHVDGLRLDAIQMIFDRSGRPFLEELADEVHALGDALGRRVHVIGETNTNDTRLVRPPEGGGTGLDAIWADDLHHALHAVLTGERDGYYADFGTAADVAKAWERGLAYDGRRSRYRGHRRGRSPRGAGPARFVVCSQNHDQVGNRRLGERLVSLTDEETAGVAAAVVLLCPHVPLLFMGEEWGETRPFLFFTSHGDPDLVEAVRRGRAAELRDFWAGSAPDPQALSSFEGSKLDRTRRSTPGQARMEALYGALLAARRALPLHAGRIEVGSQEDPPGFMARFTAEGAGDPGFALLVNLSHRPARLPLPEGPWRPVLDTARFPDVDDAPPSGERPRRSALLLRRAE